jgi:hypothetical protein
MALLSRARASAVVCFRLSFALVLTLRVMAAEAAPALDEYRVKAAFLYNFARFVDWPTEAFRSPGEPFMICVIGEDPFGASLDDVVAGKTIGGRPVAVRRISDARQPGACQVLFVGPSADKRALSVLTSLKSAVLTVGDAANSISAEAIIRFTMDSGKVRFEINTGAADRALLHISAKLLSLAQGGRK